jgi:leader peptidase (prepilin peptidase)/N-methyltransferase
MNALQLTRTQPNVGDGDYLLCGFAGAAILGGIAVNKSVDLFALVRLLTVGFALGWVTVSDLRERRIPNRVTIPAAGICLALWLTGGAHARDLVSGVVVGVLVLGIGLCGPRALGMGDVKLVLLILVGLGADAVPALGLALVIAALAALSAVVLGGLTGSRRRFPSRRSWFSPHVSLRHGECDEQ